MHNESYEVIWGWMVGMDELTDGQDFGPDKSAEAIALYNRKINERVLWCIVNAVSLVDGLRRLLAEGGFEREEYISQN